jgi:hypothetical protein
MSNHPVNLALRFFLELAAAWGTFRVPDDPGKPPVQVPGWVRLLLEVVFFGTAVMLLSVEQSTMAFLFGVVVALHYVASYDRIIWLLAER